jgi:hypothetical protein
MLQKAWSAECLTRSMVTRAHATRQVFFGAYNVMYQAQGGAAPPMVFGFWRFALATPMVPPSPPAATPVSCMMYVVH